MLQQKVINRMPVLVLAVGIAVLALGCHANAGNGQEEMPPQPLPVIAVDTVATTVYKDYTSALEGRVNVEIRPQVDGYLQKIFVDEGAYVQAGQPLFKIDDRPYAEQLHNATAALHMAEANLSSAQIELDKYAPLVQNGVVSDIQLKTSRAAFASSKASVEQAKANVQSAGINLDYTLIKAPVSGFIGKIPFRIGSLVGKSQSQQLTTLTDVQEIYAYFTMGETDFIRFKQQYPGNTLQEKLKQLPPVTLVLPDNSEYPQKGRISVINGQFDKNTGSISLRATFPNAQGLLRAGNTGKIRLPSRYANAMLIPQAATVELQEKVFVYTVADSNKVKRNLVTVAGKSGNNYIVSDGVKPGDKIVASGVDRLQEGAVIQPQLTSADSLHASR